MDVGGIRDNSRIDGIQPGEVNKTGGTGKELPLPSGLDVRKELAEKSEVNTGAIKSLIGGLKDRFSDGSRSDVPNVQDKNKMILSPLVSPKGVDAAAKVVAEAYKENPSEENTSLGAMMKNVVVFTALKSETQE